MVRIFTSLILFCLLLSISIDASVRIKNQYSLGDKFTYFENRTTTTINLFTGEKKIQQEETIYTERIIKLEDPLTNTGAEIEKTYSFARFIPSDEHAARRLLSESIREDFNSRIEWSLKPVSVGDRWTGELLPNIDGHITVTRIYDSDEFDTKVIKINSEAVGTLALSDHQAPTDLWITEDIDVETDTLLFRETIFKMTLREERKTVSAIKKLIKRETHLHEL
jgi:hypothetical protein